MSPATNEYLHAYSVLDSRTLLLRYCRVSFQVPLHRTGFMPGYPAYTHEHFSGFTTATTDLFWSSLSEALGHSTVQNSFQFHEHLNANCRKSIYIFSYTSIIYMNLFINVLQNNRYQLSHPLDHPFQCFDPKSGLT